MACAATAAVRPRSKIKIAAKVSPHEAEHKPPSGVRCVCLDAHAYVGKRQDSTVLGGIALSLSPWPVISVGKLLIVPHAKYLTSTAQRLRANCCVASRSARGGAQSLEFAMDVSVLKNQ